MDSSVKQNINTIDVPYKEQELSPLKTETEDHGEELTDKNKLEHHSLTYTLNLTLNDDSEGLNASSVLNLSSLQTKLSKINDQSQSSNFKFIECNKLTENNFNKNNIFVNKIDSNLNTKNIESSNHESLISTTGPCYKHTMNSSKKHVPKYKDPSNCNSTILKSQETGSEINVINYSSYMKNTDSKIENTTFDEKLEKQVTSDNVNSNDREDEPIESYLDDFKKRIEHLNKNICEGIVDISSTTKSSTNEPYETLSSRIKGLLVDSPNLNIEVPNAIHMSSKEHKSRKLKYDAESLERITHRKTPSEKDINLNLNLKLYLDKQVDVSHCRSILEHCNEKENTSEVMSQTDRDKDLEDNGQDRHKKTVKRKRNLDKMTDMIELSDYPHVPKLKKKRRHKLQEQEIDSEQISFEKCVGPVLEQTTISCQTNSIESQEHKNKKYKSKHKFRTDVNTTKTSSWQDSPVTPTIAKTNDIQIMSRNKSCDYRLPKSNDLPKEKIKSLSLTNIQSPELKDFNSKFDNVQTNCTPKISEQHSLTQDSEINYSQPDKKSSKKCSVSQDNCYTKNFNKSDHLAVGSNLSEQFDSIHIINKVTRKKRQQLENDKNSLAVSFDELCSIKVISTSDCEFPNMESSERKEKIKNTILTETSPDVIVKNSKQDHVSINSELKSALKKSNKQIDGYFEKLSYKTAEDVSSTLLKPKSIDPEIPKIQDSGTFESHVVKKHKKKSKEHKQDIDDEKNIHFDSRMLRKSSKSIDINESQYKAPSMSNEKYMSGVNYSEFSNLQVLNIAVNSCLNEHINITDKTDSGKQMKKINKKTKEFNEKVITNVAETDISDDMCQKMNRDICIDIDEGDKINSEKEVAVSESMNLGKHKKLKNKTSKHSEEITEQIAFNGKDRQRIAGITMKKNCSELQDESVINDVSEANLHTNKPMKHKKHKNKTNKQRDDIAEVIMGVEETSTTDSQDAKNIEMNNKTTSDPEIGLIDLENPKKKKLIPRSNEVSVDPEKLSRSTEEIYIQNKKPKKRKHIEGEDKITLTSDVTSDESIKFKKCRKHKKATKLAEQNEEQTRTSADLDKTKKLDSNINRASNTLIELIQPIKVKNRNNAKSSELNIFDEGDISSNIEESKLTSKSRKKKDYAETQKNDEGELFIKLEEETSEYKKMKKSKRKKISDETIATREEEEKDEPFVLSDIDISLDTTNRKVKRKKKRASNTRDVEDYVIIESNKAIERVKKSEVSHQNCQIIEINKSLHEKLKEKPVCDDSETNLVPNNSSSDTLNDLGRVRKSKSRDQLLGNNGKFKEDDKKGEVAINNDSIWKNSKKWNKNLNIQEGSPQESKADEKCKKKKRNIGIDINEGGKSNLEKEIALSEYMNLEKHKNKTAIITMKKSCSELQDVSEKCKKHKNKTNKQRDDSAEVIIGVEKAQISTKIYKEKNSTDLTDANIDMNNKRTDNPKIGLIDLENPKKKKKLKKRSNEISEDPEKSSRPTEEIYIQNKKPKKRKHIEGEDKMTLKSDITSDESINLKKHRKHKKTTKLVEQNEEQTLTDILTETHKKEKYDFTQRTSADLDKTKKLDSGINRASNTLIELIRPIEVEDRNKAKTSILNIHDEGEISSNIEETKLPSKSGKKEDYAETQKNDEGELFVKLEEETSEYKKIKKSKRKKKSEEAIATREEEEKVENFVLSDIDISMDTTNIKVKRKKKHASNTRDVEDYVVIESDKEIDRVKKSEEAIATRDEEEKDEPSVLSDIDISMDTTNIKVKRKKKHARNTRDVEDYVIIESDKEIDRVKKSEEAIATRDEEEKDEPSVLSDIDISMDTTNIKVKRKKKHARNTRDVEDYVIIESDKEIDRVKKSEEAIATRDEEEKDEPSVLSDIDISMDTTNIKVKRKKKHARNTRDVEDYVVIESDKEIDRVKKSEEVSDLTRIIEINKYLHETLKKKPVCVDTERSATNLVPNNSSSDTLNDLGIALDRVLKTKSRDQLSGNNGQFKLDDNKDEIDVHDDSIWKNSKKWNNNLNIQEDSLKQELLQSPQRSDTGESFKYRRASVSSDEGVDDPGFIRHGHMISSPEIKLDVQGIERKMRNVPITKWFKKTTIDADHDSRLFEKVKKTKSTSSLLEDRISELDLSEIQTEKLMNLHVLIPWHIPQLHLIATSAGTQPSKTQQENIKSAGLDVKLGKFTQKEDNIIKRNWEEFCKLHDWDVLDCMPLLRFKHSNGTELAVSDRTKFVQFLSHDLNDRIPNTVYKRFRRLYSEHRTITKIGRFTPIEDEIILTHLKSRTPKPFSEIGKILGRDQGSVLKRYRTLGLLNTQKKESILWTNKLFEQLIQVLMKVTLCVDVKELRNKEITLKEWHEVSDDMGMEVPKVKRAWFVTLYPRLFSKNVDMTNIKMRLILFLYHTFNDWKEVDWKMVAEEFDGFTGPKLFRLIKDMVHSHVPLPKQDYLRKSMKHLKKHLDESKIHNRSLPRLRYVDGVLLEKNKL